MTSEHVIILAGRLPKSLPAKIVNRVCKKNCRIICADAGIKPLSRLGIIADYLVGDLDTIKRTQQTYSNFLHLITAPSEKDATDTELALKVAAMHYPHAKMITLLGWNGGRLDHLLANIAWVNQPQFSSIVEKVQLIDEHNVVHFLLPGSHTLEAQAGFNYIGFVVLKSCANLTVTNFKYELPKCDVGALTVYSSNEFIETAAGKISFTSGIIAAIYSHD